MAKTQPSTFNTQLSTSNIQLQTPSALFIELASRISEFYLKVGC